MVSIGWVNEQIKRDTITPKKITINTDVSDYADAGSYQPLEADLNLAVGAGTSEAADSAYLAPVMGNVLGANLTKTGNYVAGGIFAYNITGTNASTYPKGPVIAEIGDTTTTADGAVVAAVGGDSGVTTAEAAFKAMSNNSTAGSGFNYGLDLTSAAHDGYNALAILKADIRGTNNVVVMNGAGVPSDGTTGDDFAGPGSLYIDTTNKEAYINAGTITDSVWKKITRAA